MRFAHLEIFVIWQVMFNANQDRFVEKVKLDNKELIVLRDIISQHKILLIVFLVLQVYIAHNLDFHQ